MALVLAGVAAVAWQFRPRPAATPLPTASSRPAVVDAITALGRLEPAGDIRNLAAPMSEMGGSPRISELLVQEGDRVAAGQRLARFDNRPALQAQRSLEQSRIVNLTRRLAVVEREVNRYRQLARDGAVAASELETRELTLLELQGSLREARDQLIRTETDLVNSELRAPISGTVLNVESRVGERPGDQGILQIGASDRMEVVAEVYESDIRRVSLGQTARITSENGGFDGSLRARVIRISPQVQQREVLATDPTGDADARVVVVRLALDPVDIEKVRNLTGTKTITRFDP